MVLGLDMRFLGQKRRKKWKSSSNGRNKGDIRSLRPLGFAPAFGRVVAPFGAALTGMRERLPFSSLYATKRFNRSSKGDCGAIPATQAHFS